MIFYYNASGDILSAVFDEVYQGSNKANTIYFVCPTLRSNTVNVAFTLPDGTDTARHTMTLDGNGALDGVFDGDGNSFSVWNYKVPTAITAKRGTVRVQFYIVTPTETIATAAVDFTVRKGVSGATPEIGDAYEELVSLMSEYSARMDDAEEDIADNETDIESAVVGGAYDDNSKSLILTLKNGNTITVSVGDLISGLVPDGRTIAGLNLSANVSKADLTTALGFSITEITI